MTVLKKLNIIKVKENVQVSEKENTSDTKDSVNNSSSESKMNTSIFGEAVFGVIRLKINSWFRKYPKKRN